MTDADRIRDLSIGPFSRAELQRVSVVIIVLIALGFGWALRDAATNEMIDHRLFSETVAEMRSGAGYYEAMETAFSRVYGPERVDVTESVFGFRPPTVFVLWRLLPPGGIWAAFVVASAISGVLASVLARFPLSGVLVTVYLLTLGLFSSDGDWTAQFLATELWVVPVMLGAMLAVKDERWWLAVGLAFVAFAIRETTAPLLVIGLLVAILGYVPWRPWFIAVLVAAGFYWMHAALASGFIDPEAGAPLPTGGEIPGSTLRIMGMGLPAGLVAGPVLWVLAVKHVLSMQENRLLMSAYLWLPLVGLALERHYWGIIVVPFTLIWGIDEGFELAGRGRRAPKPQSPQRSAG
jgi:hypothetical protein